MCNTWSQGASQIFRKIMSLKIHNLHVSVGKSFDKAQDKKEILKGINLEIQPGEVHCIMGPNGSGKSTLANVLMGHPKYTVTSGEIILSGENITAAKVQDRAKKGLFLSQQYLPEVAGVTVSSFLRTAISAKTGEKQHPVKFHKKLLEIMASLGIDKDFAGRYLNVGFSGGEKKRLETLQLKMLDPQYAILDETDSGLDVDALKSVSEGINTFQDGSKGILLITHYNRILQYVVPDFVHIMIGGTLVKSGGKELAEEIEKNGYTNIV